MRLHPSMRDNVIFLSVFEEGEYIAVGTAFVLAVVEENLLYSYLITCKHVVKPSIDDGEPIYGRFNRSDGLGIEHVRLENKWVYHEDTNVDIAVLSWDSKAVPRRFEWGALDIQDAASSKEILEQTG